jgi:hypothetical protein
MTSPEEGENMTPQQPETQYLQTRYPEAPGETPAQPAVPGSRVSRRWVLRGAAGAGAAGLVVAGTAGIVASSASSAAAPAARPGGTPDAAANGPVVVYLRDATTGEIDVFAGTSQVRLRDPALASQLLRAIQ